MTQPAMTIDLPTGAKERLAMIPMPSRIAALKRDHRGYPIPAFVEWVDGKPDFRIMSSTHFTRCVKHEKCWICGDALGRFKTFVIGPMCIVNRTSSEPPAHRECAQYAAMVCPFLAIPEMRRLPAVDGATMAGIGITRNPGVICLWTVTTKYSTYQARGGVLIEIPKNPTSVEWFARGRAATREEVFESMASGLPILRQLALTQEGAMEALDRMYGRALNYLPQAEGLPA